MPTRQRKRAPVKKKAAKKLNKKVGIKKKPAKKPVKGKPVSKAQRNAKAKAMTPKQAR